MAYETIKELLHSEQVDREVTAKGWVRSARGNKYVLFIHLNDGSTIKNIQAVADIPKFDEETLKRAGATGACIGVTGKLVQSQGKGQSLEIQAEKIEIYGDCDPELYPLQKRGQDSKDKKPVTLPLEFLREKAHLRPRTNTFGAILRIRHNMTFAIHKFFNDKGFYNLHSPIITGSDAEGAGEMFRVTTLPIRDTPLINKELDEVAKRFRGEVFDLIKANGQADLIKSISSAIKDITRKKKLSKSYDFSDLIVASIGQVQELKAISEDVKKNRALVDQLQTAFDALIRGEYFQNLGGELFYGYRFQSIYEVDLNKPARRRFSSRNHPQLMFSFYNFMRFHRKLRADIKSEVDFTYDFFGKATNLTVSGQLEGELAALALGKIYTFGPTFRAENSNTPRHLAEFWMIEPEMAFYDINDNMNLAEEMLKYLINYALHHCKDDVQFLNDTYDNKLIERLQSVLDKPFTRISYTEGVEILKETHSKKAFEFQPDWGKDLQKEHENYLVEHFGGPVIVTGYPKDIKAFYMKQNEDGKTVHAMDILFPWIGEIIGGSQREDNYDKLYARVKEMGIHEESLWWYLETRKFGSCEHAGFGLGFERLLLFVTGMTNIRDVIPFPRTPKNAEF